MTCWDKGIGHSRYRRQSHGRTCTHGGPAKANGLFGQMARKTADTRRQHAHKYHMHLPLPPESEAGPFPRKRIGQQNDRLRDSSAEGWNGPPNPAVAFGFAGLSFRAAGMAPRCMHASNDTLGSLYASGCPLAAVCAHIPSRCCSQVRPHSIGPSHECRRVRFFRNSADADATELSF